MLITNTKCKNKVLQTCDTVNRDHVVAKVINYSFKRIDSFERIVLKKNFGKRRTFYIIFSLVSLFNKLQ